MLDRINGRNLPSFIHFVACLAIAIGLPWSKIPLSIGTILLVVNILFLRDFKQLWLNWKKYPFLFYLALFIAIDLLSIFWSSDIKETLGDLKQKLPLYVLPFCLLGYPIEKKKYFDWVLIAFLSSVTFFALLNLLFYFQVFGEKKYDDLRGLSLFVSHIRFGILVVCGMISIIYLFKKSIFPKSLLVVMILLLSFYTYYSGVISGYVSFCLLLFSAFLFYIRTKKIVIKTVFSVSFIAVFSMLTWFFIDAIQPVKHKINISDLPKFTKKGNEYVFVSNDDPNWVNGYPVLGKLCEKELELAWNSRSKIDYKNGFSSNKQKIRFPIWYYLTSKNLSKDAEGIAKLSNKEIKGIENGSASVECSNGVLSQKMFELRSELEQNVDPNDKSFLQRIIAWKVSWKIIQNNWLFGVGKGDYEKSFENYYSKHSHGLKKENQLPSHNQYLNSWIRYGILGFLLFIVFHLSLIRFAWKKHNFALVTFLLIICASYLIEDTLETQTGITLFAFLFPLFLKTKQFESENLT